VFDIGPKEIKKKEKRKDSRKIWDFPEI